VLPVGWLVVAVILAVLLSMWVTFTLTRLDRLHARVDAAWAALDAQLVRRAAALQHVAESPDSGVRPDLRPPCEQVAQAALGVEGGAERQAAENAVGHMITRLAEVVEPLQPEAEAELREGAARVRVARRFYNDAVRDTRTLRSRRRPRLLRLAGRRVMPHFFDSVDPVTMPVRQTRPMSAPASDAGEPI
jgi:hypothetical protein